MTAKSPQRRYPWETARFERATAVSEPKAPAIISQVPRVALGQREAAAALGISCGTLQALERSGQAPPSLVLPGGRRRLYPVDGLAKWAAELAAGGTDDEVADP